MTMARRDIIGEEGNRGVYHCMVRCVRRAFLCGEDAYSGKNYDHRKEWIRDRLGVLTRSFGVDLLTYSVMSNHLHTVLRTRPDVVESWSDAEVAERWLNVYMPRHMNKDGEVVYEVRELDIERLLENEERIAQIRKRLSSLSWFMKALNEHISRQANKEDKCKGRFWESRFKSQRLEGEAAILACMCYVDLNPVRAKLAEGLEDSLFTGVYDRIMTKKAEARQKKIVTTKMSAEEKEQSEKQFEEAVARSRDLVDLGGPERPLYHLDEQSYFSLLDWTGRQIRSDKPGAIHPEVRDLLEGLELDADEWVKSITRYNSLFGSIVGSVEQLQQLADEMGRRWLKGCRKARSMFKPPDSAQQPA